MLLLVVRLPLHRTQYFTHAQVKHLPTEDTSAPAPESIPSTKPSKSDESEDDSSSDEEMEEAAVAASKTKPKKSKVIRALADLGVYISSHSFKDWQEASEFSL